MEIHGLINMKAMGSDAHGFHVRKINISWQSDLRPCRARPARSGRLSVQHHCYAQVRSICSWHGRANAAVNCCARAAFTAPAGLVSTWAALSLRGTGINEGTDNQGMR